MKRALILYWHGLGDVIQLTPVLRKLHRDGYVTDLMCRPEVSSSHLFDECPYVSMLIPVVNPWQSPIGKDEQTKKNIAMFEDRSKKYDWSAKCLHKDIKGLKVDWNFRECGIDPMPSDRHLEVFIPSWIESEAMSYIEKNYPNGYVFRHTDVKWHPWHTWNSSEWIQKTFPGLPVFDTGDGALHDMPHKNINYSFVLAREAKRRVLSSSVFVHACEAMGSVIDVVNYGKPDRKVWPRDLGIVKGIRESGKTIPQCPLCGNLYEQCSRPSSLRCLGCGAIRLAKVPDLDSMRPGLKNMLLGACRDKKKLEGRLKDAHHQIDLLEKYSKPGKVYDIGAASGWFMKVAKERGWDPKGNEVSTAAIKWAKGHYDIDIEYGFLEELRVDLNVYSAIVMWNTLEHVPDPAKVLSLCNRMLVEGGVLLVRVPHNHHDLKKYFTPAHITEFNEKNLPHYLEAHGFERLEVNVCNTGGLHHMDLIYRRK